MTAGSIATQQAVELDLFAVEAAWTGRFDRLEIWRSRATEQGPFELLTDDAWKPARVPAEAVGDVSSDPGPTANLDGKTLELLVNEVTAITITFDGSDPFTWAEAAVAITEQGLGLVRAFMVSTGVVGWLVVETLAPGLGAVLRVVGGDAAPLLGLPTVEPESVAFGRDPRLALVAGKSRYAFTDPNGAPEYFYKTRFFNGSTRETSAFSAAFTAPAIARLSSAALVRGTVDLVDAMGNPIANRSVLVYQRLQGTTVEGKAVVGGAARRSTDDAGHAEFMLARGLRITVSIAGTDLSRDIDVPTDPAITTFNLLDPYFGKDDLFAVQRPNIPFAARRSL